MRTFVVILALCLAAATPSAAQSADPSAAPGREEHLALAGRYLELTQGSEVFKQLRGQIDESYGELDLPEEQRSWMADQMATAIQESVEATLVELRDDVADRFTVAELEAAITFYTSPLGREIVRKQVDLNFEMQRIAMPLLAERLGNLMEKFCQRFDCEALAESAIKNQR